MNKIESFKYVISSFHEQTLPEMVPRSLVIPEHNKIITISGVRRAGKTFYFYQLIINLLKKKIPLKCILYINFEDERLFPLSIENLQDLFDAYYELYPELVKEHKFLFLDEIQEIDYWQKFVRRLQDIELISIYLTGSSSKLLSSEIPSALRGRTLTYKIFPMDFKEFLQMKKIDIDENYEYSSQRFLLKKSLTDYIEYGSYPEVIKENELKFKILQDYYDLVIFRDIIERNEIRNTFALKSLLKYLFTNIANLFSLNKYAKIEGTSVKISKNTLSDYISYILASELIYFVPRYVHSLKAQQVNPVKVYCIDTGLRNAISFKFSTDIGRLVENVVFIELLRRGYEVYYWKQKNEVDFVVRDKKGGLTAFNVSYTDDIISRELMGLEEINEYLEIKTRILITKDVAKQTKGIKCIPLWIWLLKNQL